MASGTDSPLPDELGRVGRRVTVRTIRVTDEPAYRAAVQRSRDRLIEWNPADPSDLPHHLAGQSASHRTFLILAREPDPDQPLVGKVNVSNVVFGRSRSGTLGYDAFDPYAGRGLFGEGLRLVVDIALSRVAAGGMGLHRVEASVQPGNVRSAAALRSMGFQPEGASRDLLWLPDRSGQEAWRDHVRYAVTAPQWPAPPYAPILRDRLVVIFDLQGDPAALDFAVEVAVELGLPLLAVGRLGLGPAELVSLLAACPGGAVVADSLSTPGGEALLAAVRLAEPAAIESGWGDVTPGPSGAATRHALALRAAARS